MNNSKKAKILILPWTLWKHFTILLFSGYADLPRHPMFWGNTADAQNSAMLLPMSKNRFDEIIQNLHLADNSSLDPNDKLKKVSQLIEKINEQCLLQIFNKTNS